MNIKVFLKGNQLFADLSDEELDAVVPYIKVEYFNKEQTVFKEDTPGFAMYIVANGEIKILKQIDDAKTKTLAQMAEGDCFGEMALIDGNMRSATARAATPAALLSFTKEQFTKLMYDNPYIAFKIIMRVSKMLSKRLRNTNEQMIDILNYHFKGRR